MTDPRIAARDEDLLARLDPELARQLFPERFPEPLRISLEFPTPDADVAAELEESLQAAGRQDDGGRTTATFTLRDVEALHAAFTLLDQRFGSAEVEVRINGKDVPMARELWLPLLWSLRS